MALLSSHFVYLLRKDMLRRNTFHDSLSLELTSQG